ncbi:hypothetical protein DSCW_12800 [Desulfosarcina widdelii]|uniref:Uncharacterized protein n=2 Tax=Desulfosarcina widdelii TaxID=947919 RepID=A0A5K7Z191_9BACT|nr:hypothetical protein DSCW_12800 [Desulfosarcina widdelii]
MPFLIVIIDDQYERDLIKKTKPNIAFHIMTNEEIFGDMVIENDAVISKYDYPLQEYIFSIENKNSDSVTLKNFSIQFNFQNTIQTLNGRFVLEKSDGAHFYSALIAENDAISVYNEIDNTLNESFSFDIRKLVQDNESIKLNIADLILKKLPTNRIFYGEIVIDMIDKPPLTINNELIDLCLVNYSYEIAGNVFKESIENKIPRPAIELKLAVHHYKNSKKFFKEGNYNGALFELNNAIYLMPNYVSAYILRGRTYSKLRHYDDAESDFKKVIEIRNDSIYAFYYSSINFAVKGDLDKAYNDYLNVKDINPEIAKSLAHELFIIGYDYGDEQMSMGNFLDAILSYDFAFSFKPEFNSSKSKREFCWNQIGNLNSIKEKFGQKCKLGSKYACKYQKFLEKLDDILYSDVGTFAFPLSLDKFMNEHRYIEYIPHIYLKNFEIHCYRNQDMELKFQFRNYNIPLVTLSFSDFDSIRKLSNRSKLYISISWKEHTIELGLNSKVVDRYPQ